MSKVFISYIHEEEKVAEAVQSLLRDKLVPREDVFLSCDEWQVFAGEIWLERIKDELESAEVVILLLSSRSVKRPWVNFEAGAAWFKDRVIIPACIGDLSKEKLPKPYSSLQALNLMDEAYYLITSVAHHLGVLPPPPLESNDKSLVRLQDALGAI